MGNIDLNGIYAAAVTPIKESGNPDLKSLPLFLDFLARRGCHGALLLGTTGEGPSFSTKERISIFTAALRVRETHPSFRLNGGTGSPSLEETVELTHAAFDLGFEGVVTLPPYYFRDATDEGLFRWFSQVLQRSTPSGGSFLGYHFPAVSGVSLSIELLSRLKDAHPDKFAGIKDSSGDRIRGKELGDRFGASLKVFTGNDRLLQESLTYQGAGCITAAANLLSNQLRNIWEAHKRGEIDPHAQGNLDLGRQILEGFKPFAPAIKAILANHFGLGPWPARPPLIDLQQESAEALGLALVEANLLE